ncbi:MAG: hypothetical protein ACE15E_01455 [Acidobacteriota bacterium]
MTKIRNLIFTFSVAGSLALGQDPAPDPEPAVAYSMETTLATNFVWRGQRLTDGCNFQPSGTLSVKGFAANVWGKLDLQAVSEGDDFYLRDNPAAPPGGGSGLRGKFSEVDLTLSYARELGDVSMQAGLITYILPYNLGSCPSTTEVFGGVSLDSVPLAPAVRLNVDIDETRKRGQAGLYLELAGGHSFPLSSKRLKSVDISGTVGITNAGFAEYCYDFDEAGFHDVSFSAHLPLDIGRGWTSKLFLTYSSLLGKYRDYQFVNLPDLYRGTAGPPSSYADTIWGGITFAFGP